MSRATDADQMLTDLTEFAAADARVSVGQFRTFLELRDRIRYLLYVDEDLEEERAAGELYPLLETAGIDEPRLEALRLSVAARGDHETPENTVERARAYAAFLEEHTNG